MIFVDTGAWYALAIPSDPDHDQAKAFVASNSEPFLTTDYIVDELLTLFAVRGQKSLNGVATCSTAVQCDSFASSKKILRTRSRSTSNVKTSLGALLTALVMW
jgi:predicted nucleic acid-binding protein